MKLKKAFTLAEAILTMTILGIIAAVMITTLKPSSYKSQGFAVLKQKIYTELDDVSQTILVECCKKMSFASIYENTSAYDDCSKTLNSYTFSANVAHKYVKYLRGTRNTASCPARIAMEDNIAGTASENKTYVKASGIKLRNGACVWFRGIASTETDYYDESSRIGSILVDVNGSEGPNALGDGNDRIVFYVGVDGITSDMPKK